MYADWDSPCVGRHVAWHDVHSQCRGALLQTIETVYLQTACCWTTLRERPTSRGGLREDNPSIFSCYVAVSAASLPPVVSSCVLYQLSIVLTFRCDQRSPDSLGKV